MMLSEQTTIASAALPLAAFKDHLRLGSGFADEPAQDALAESYLRAAMAAIEGRIGKILMARNLVWMSSRWRGGRAVPLPVAPVRAILSLTLYDEADRATVIDPGRYRLVQDLQRPRIVGLGGGLPAMPAQGRVEIVFEAGFGPVWSDLPADLAQAVFLLAAEYYEMRHDGASGGGGALPHAVTALIERWRTVRVLGGGAA